MLFRHRHHVRDDPLAFCRLLIVLGLAEHDLHLGLMLEVVERGDDAPAVHLTLVDLLGAVIETRGVTETDGVRGGEQPEIRMG